MKTRTDDKRRKFLLAGMGAGVAAATVAGVRKAGAPAAADKAAEAQQDGYRASEHILKYYKTAEV